MKLEDFKIKLEFTVDEMNQIFRFLGRTPYDDVAGLIDHLKKEVDKQLIAPEDFDDFPGKNTEDNLDHPL
jgi:hypothetical protein